MVAGPALQVCCAERPGKQKCGKGVGGLGEAVDFLGTRSQSFLCSCNIFLVIRPELDQNSVGET